MATIAAQLPGGFEWIIILIVIGALLFFGPQKLPEMMRSIGRAMGEFRRGKLEVEREISSELQHLDEKKYEEPQVEVINPPDPSDDNRKRKAR